MDIAAAKSQPLENITDGLCPCRGCSVARKKVFNDINSIIKNTNSKGEILEELIKYKESGYGIH